mmetsp:Transcript_68110/g.127193  ORF Transcript_68110/g.127193 Transcript_68110/m.127193 type:complete len:389 (+) Transcript_68110:57-1223(+)
MRAAIILALWALQLAAAYAERPAGQEMLSQSHALVQLQVDRARTANIGGNATSSISNETSNLDVIDKVVFIKLHSVGSSTMTSILHHYCENHQKNCFVYPIEIAPGSTVDSGTLGSIVSAFSSADKRPLDIWPNHVVMDTPMFNSLIPGNFMISLFRDPLDRIMSSFRHGETATVLETMQSLQQNIMTTHCGAAAYPMAKQITPEQVSKLDLVMLTEEYDLSLMLLRKALGWSLFDMMYRRMKDDHDDDLVASTVNFGEYLSQPYGDLNPATLEYLAQCMGADETTVYLYAKARFQQQWEDLSAAEQQQVLEDQSKFQAARASLEDCCESSANDSYCVALSEDNVEWNHRYQGEGYTYTTMQLNGQTPAAAITQESSCMTLVKSALHA